MDQQTTLNRIFIIDDDPDSLSFMTAILEEQGNQVSTTTASDRAFKTILAEKPDLVLVDLMMPGKDGLELVQELKERKEMAKTKFVVVSAKPYEFDRRRAFQMGADGYITKPLNASTFMTKLNRIIDDKMELTYWGVRGTLPRSGPDSLKYGGNTSCVSIEFAKGQFFIFDAGSGIKVLSDRLLREKRTRMEAKVFISHPHWDHINALPFFAPLYFQGNEFEILGASHGDISMREMISAQMDGVYFPIRIKQFGARVYFRNLGEEVIDLDGITVKTKLLNHPGKCLGYRVEHNGHAICYITDNELDLEDSDYYNPFYINRLTEFCFGADILITDTTYSDDEYRSKIGWGHSCVSEVVKLAHAAKVKELHLFHHDPDQTDKDIDNKLKMAEAKLKELGSSTVVSAPGEGTSLRI